MQEFSSLICNVNRIESVLAECDSDEEYDQVMDQSNDKKKAKKRQKLDTWIQESDQIMDLTDPVSLQRISGMK